MNIPERACNGKLFIIIYRTIFLKVISKRAQNCVTMINRGFNEKTRILKVYNTHSREIAVIRVLFMPNFAM